ncbi:hypothetical protein vBAbaMPhT2_006 [Acinetobacter phage vB_AbaM_PhT2]|uniref:Uncharacterized protein n=1 Tax=Acinetobacter phage vB_AbaM_PhT2 TaxID=2690230 RepID=A0A6B9SYK5_9CAUD|nr:hypothetical protein HYQ24_gp006 [Acinetobacter phage vB_AbaM_PhT2]QHJ75618.1 hypothetical protein vBAbaMPhT2_006 [Acinetobacter phage vB_AbaM_PhT2]
MKILYLPCRSVPFMLHRVDGGLEAVQYNFIVNMSKVHDIDYVAFGDEMFGDVKVNTLPINKPIGAKFTTAHAYKIKYKLQEITDWDQYDAIVIIEGSKMVLNTLAELGQISKVRNILATPLDPSVRGIVQCWNNAVMVHKLGGKNIVPTQTFKDLASKVYSKMNERIAAEVIDFEYWQANDIIADEFYPPILIEEMPEVLESEGHIVQAQRFDNAFRKSNVAFGAMDLYQGPKLAFCPSKWAPGKKWLEKPWVVIDSSRQNIQLEISVAKLLVNTCHNTGTVENGSLEAISKGVPVLQLIEKGYNHATFEYDPNTVRVEFETGTSTQDLIELYAKALNEFEDTYEQRVARAKYLFEKFNKDAYFKLWEIVLK